MPDPFEETVADFLRRHGLFAGAQRILLAVSGGADSTALVHVLAVLKAQGHVEPDLVCAHINHQLRGPDSDADEQFVVEQATGLGLPVIARSVDVQAYARTHGLSLETAARQLRLAGLGEIARHERCTWIGTGHQKSDNAETVLHRLGRGTGFRGLAGIRPARRLGDLRLASPLLCATRHDIVRYLERRGLHWREDQTNADVTYTRNYIRHKLLPFLQRDAQSCLTEELSELAASATKLLDRIERETEEAWSRVVELGPDKVIVDASALASLPEPIAIELIRVVVMRIAAGGTDLAEPHYRGILHLACPTMGGKEVEIPGGFSARREGEQIVLSASRRVRLAPPDFKVATLQVPGRIQFAGREIEAKILQHSEVDAARIAGDKSRFVEYFDLDRLTLPVVVRRRRPGDRFQPLGMTEEKKVGKFLTTAKVPHDLRDRILIFADRERIIWICPIRISDQAKVTEGTQHLLQLTIRNT